MQLVLKGGHVVDPANNLDGPTDLGIQDGRIAAVGPDLSGDRELDLSGHYVTPGIIDMHAHVFITHRRSRLSVLPEVQFSGGVTTVVDAGTSGWRDFADFKREVIDQAKARVLAYVNIVGQGMLGEWEHDVSEMSPRLAAAVVQEYPEVAVGIKTAHYWTQHPFDAAHPPWAAVERAVEAGEICGKPVMVDFWPKPERPYRDLILEKLRPGDIHTHVFAQQFPVLDEQGRVSEFMHEARARGIIFDVGHGAGSFWFRNAAPAIEQGFVPDSISTDLHTGNMNGPVFDMLETMNKIMALGVPLTDVIRMSTVAPASEIGHPELGTLSVGAEADVAAFRLDRGAFPMTDCGRARIVAPERLRCVLTLRAGDVVYNPGALGIPEWRDAPDPYWWDPAALRSTRLGAAR